jgi:hypothetical protein
MLVLSIDPGRDKCGIALVSDTSGVVVMKVIKTGELVNEISKLKEEHSPEVFIMGSGTGSANLKKVLKDNFDIIPEIINESHSTEYARVRFFKENPPKGLKRLIPIGLQLPSVPYDDYAALIIAEKYFEQKR